MSDVKKIEFEEFKININGKEVHWKEKLITYLQLVDLAFPSQKDTQVFTIQYVDGPPKNPSGTLVKGQEVILKNHMKFHVTPTDKS